METIVSVEQALSLFEKYAIIRGNALNEGNSRIANKCYDKLRKITTYLKKEKQLSQLSTFYNHHNLHVRSVAAAYLLPIFEEKSIKVLKEIAKLHVFGSFDAEMTIKEWKNGNLKNFYTVQ